MDDPDTICFLVCEWHHEGYYSDSTGWLSLVGTRGPALLSVSCIPSGRSLCGRGDVVPSRVSCYLDPSKPSSSADSASSSREIPSPVVAVDEMQTDDAGGGGSGERLSCRSPAETTATTQLLAISAALQVIPSYGMDRDDMLKAYRILSQDNGRRRLGSLLGLPRNTRKDWLLTQIKADQAY